MVKLAKKIEKNGYEYTMVERSTKAAVYEQRNIKEETDTSVSYEVFQITKTKPYSLTAKKTKTWKEGDVLKVYDYPESEKFPGNEDFGKTAWSYMNKSSAMAKFNEIK
jgi:hypothetical protein